MERNGNGNANEMECSIVKWNGTDWIGMEIEMGIEVNGMEME